MALKQKSACVRLWLAVIAMVLAGFGGDDELCRDACAQD